MRYLNENNYKQAKQGAGYIPLEKEMPVETRKLFPYSYHTNYALYYEGEKKDPLFCGKCSIDLSLWGNGKYYCAYLIFDNAHDFYACCPECMRNAEKKPMEYSNQVYGYEKPMELFELDTKIECRAVYRCVLSQRMKYKLWNSPQGITAETLQKEIYSGQCGCSFEDGFLDWSNKGLTYMTYEKDNDVFFKLNNSQIVNIINSIIQTNFKNTQQVVGQQLFLF